MFNFTRFPHIANYINVKFSKLISFNVTKQTTNFEKKLISKIMRYNILKCIKNILRSNMYEIF